MSIALGRDKMNVMNIPMKLKAKSFEAIKSGVKDIELRLNDKKRQQLKLGDVIIFSKLPEVRETVQVEVIGLLHYPTFAALIEDFAPERMGGVDKISLAEGASAHYPHEEQAALGVVGIKLRLI